MASFSGILSIENWFKPHENSALTAVINIKGFEMKVIRSLILIVFSMICFSGCESTLYVIEEVEEVVPDDIKSPPDSTIAAKTDSSEIKEDLKSERIKEEKAADKDVVSREYAIQLGAFSNEQNAINFLSKAKGKISEDVYYKEVQGLFKVRIGKLGSKSEALSMLEKVISYGFTDSFLVELTYVKVPE